MRTVEEWTDEARQMFMADKQMPISDAVAKVMRDAINERLEAAADLVMAGMVWAGDEKSVVANEVTEANAAVIRSLKV